MAINAVTLNRIDTSLNELLRLSVKKKNATEISAKIARGRDEVAALVKKTNELRESLTAIKNFSTSADYFISRNAVAARSLEMGLSYDPDNPANDDPSKLLSSVGKFSGVSAGSIKINGVSVAVDPGADSLNDILDRINSSDAGVTASVDPTADRLVLTSSQAGKPIVVDDGSTGLMAAAGLSPRTYSPGKTAKSVFSDRAAIKREIEKSAKLINELIFTGYAELDGTLLGKMRTHLVEGLKEVYSKKVGSAGDRILRTDIGFTFDLRTDSQKAVIFDYGAFDSASDSDFEKVRSFLTSEAAGTSFSTTLLGKLADNIDGIVENISGNFAQGVLIDVKG